METAGSSKTSVHINHIARRHINEESYLQTVKQPHLCYLLYCSVQRTKDYHGQNNMSCSLSIRCQASYVTRCHLKTCWNSPKNTTNFRPVRCIEFRTIFWTCFVAVCFVASPTKRGGGAVKIQVITATPLTCLKYSHASLNDGDTF